MSIENPSTMKRSEGEILPQYTFRTRPPSTYTPPLPEEMREAATAVALKSFSRDLVADLCNVAAGGSVLTPSSYRENVKRQVEADLLAPDNDGEWKIKTEINGKQYTKVRSFAVADRLANKMKYHQNVVDFIESIDLSKFPGSSPLEQTMSLLKLLSQQKGGSGGGEGGEPLPIFSDEKTDSENLAQELNEVMDMVDSMDQDELDMMDPEGKSHEIDKNSEDEKPIDKLKIAEDLVSGRAKMLEVSRNLDSFSKMQLKKQSLVTPDPAGNERRKRRMKDPSELGSISPVDWADKQISETMFWQNVIDRKYKVPEKITRNEKKQVVFILVDGSGSMSGEKHFKASGVVMNRLKAVISGDAVVYLSVFDSKMSKVHKAETPEEARELIKQYTQQNFRGGSTDIAGCVKSAQGYIEKEINSGARLYKPEIVVLTDEDTSVKSLTKADLNGTKMHGFAMSVSNPSLVAFAQSTGGVGFDRF